MISSKSLSHGGNLFLATKEFKGKEEDFLDYSSNINPLGVPKEYKKLIIENIDKLASYPNIDYVELTEAIGKYLNIEEKYILPTNGATEGIYLIIEHLNLKKVLIPAPSFSEYKNASENFNLDIKWHFTEEVNDFSLDIEKLKEEMLLEKVDGVFLCNPNNPTSQLIKREELLELLKVAKEKDIYLLIDESFIDLIEDEDSYKIKDYVKNYNNLVVIQSFTKFFAVPGIRIGAVIASENIIEYLFKKKMPWSINYFASLISKILLKDSDYVKKTKKWIEEEIEYFYKELLKIEGLKVYKPNTNFVLVKLENNISSNNLRELLGREKILIRDCSNFKGLDNRFVRFAIKSREQNEKFIRILKKVLEEEKSL
ncbi:MAG: threonine-phosphate decarboxylase CobD [Sarcina sp.]